MSAEKDMPFLEHVEELRWHIVRSVVAVIIAAIAAFTWGPWLFQRVILAPSRSDFVTLVYMCKLSHKLSLEQLCLQITPFKLQNRVMTGQFTMHVGFSLAIGIIVAFPYIFWEIWRFIRPGLHIREQRSSRKAVAAVSFLFLMGVSFGYFIMSPLAVWFFSSYSLSDVISNEFDISSYVSTLLTLTLGSGLLFQLPTAFYFLTRIGVVTPQLMRRYRKHAIVLTLIVGAVVTPPDPLSQMMISLPLYMLYELSIFISAMVVRKMALEEA